MTLRIAPRLLPWYAKHARGLPWRGSRDPYAVWVSEIMLQQTRVETVIPYFERWMRRFPDAAALARAEEQEVLKAWEGLGYYSRARNLQRAAREIMERFGGQLPADAQTLKSLPGVGEYTAAAIASIAFQQDEAALDGNIRRVLARVFYMDLPARTPQGEKQLRALARQELPAGQAGDYNQALMDLGSAICTPRSPQCQRCPLADICEARRRGNMEDLPVMKDRARVPHHTVTAAVIQRGRQVLLARRPAGGLLGGLWEYPGGKTQPGESLNECLRREIREELGVEIEIGAEFGIYRHAYTHFKVTLHAFLCRINGGEPQALHASELRWCEPEELESFPMGKIDRQISRRLMQQESLRNETSA